ncbi:MAG: gamma-glutamyltransferase family protein [bacterium]
MNSFNFSFPYPSQRMPVMARNMVASSQPLAVQAGINAIQIGGNAVDAALATAITLTVVEPTSNGIGSDAFAIVWDGQQLHGLNASGRLPAAVTPDDYAGLEEMPQFGWPSITVPGAVSAWVALSERFGVLPFERLFENAVDYARNGYAVSPITARAWQAAAPEMREQEGFHHFLPGGVAPAPGQWFQFPDQADTLEKIAHSHGQDFYHGEVSDQIVASSKRNQWKLSKADLESHRADWVTPISKRYGEVELHEIPPNGQGLAALLMLGILKYWNISKYPLDSADSVHLQVEAMKLALADAHRYIADPDSMDIRVEDLLNESYLAKRAEMISLQKAGFPGPGLPDEGGTVYLTAADKQGMMVSMIQSNYAGFGSGVVVDGTGISMQNRGAGFNLIPGHPNQVGGGKRPFHTIIPGFVTRQGQAEMSFGVMGGSMQPQGHAQMLIRIYDYGQNPQTASDALRWRVLEDSSLHLEQGFDPRVMAELKQRGHKLFQGGPDAAFGFGGAQLIIKSDCGYIGGSDHRKDGMVVGF